MTNLIIALLLVTLSGTALAGSLTRAIVGTAVGVGVVATGTYVGNKISGAGSNQSVPSVAGINIRCVAHGNGCVQHRLIMSFGEFAKDQGYSKVVATRFVKNGALSSDEWELTVQ